MYIANNVHRVVRVDVVDLESCVEIQAYTKNDDGTPRLEWLGSVFGRVWTELVEVTQRPTIDEHSGGLNVNQSIGNFRKGECVKVVVEEDGGVLELHVVDADGEWVSTAATLFLEPYAALYRVVHECPTCGQAVHS